MSVVGVYESVSSALSLRMKVLSVGAWLRFIHPAPGWKTRLVSGLVVNVLMATLVWVSSRMRSMSACAAVVSAWLV